MNPVELKYKVLMGILLLILGCERPASFYYEVQVENSSSHDFVCATLIQLTDVMDRGAYITTTTRIIARGKALSLKHPGEFDSPSTLLLLTCVPCNSGGNYTEIPNRAFATRTMKYQDIRRTWVDGKATEPFTWHITDADFVDLMNVKVNNLVQSSQ